MKKFRELLFLKELPNIGPSQIINVYGNHLKNDIQLEELVELIRNSTEIKDDRIQFAYEKALRIEEEVSKDGDVSVITIYDENYPPKLLDMNKGNIPLIIYAKGNFDILKKTTIAIVGTRNISLWSQKVEEKLVEKIIEFSNRVIVSGLAIGCDYVAHNKTVEMNKPTIAVLPSGINQITPKTHTGLAQKIINTGGCLISEYLPDEIADKAKYVKRDGIIAALSDATYVVECNEKSGTMHTVEYAHKIKRPIACYYTEDSTKGVYTGNLLAINKYNAIKVDNTESLESFLNSLNDSSNDKEVMNEQFSLF